MIPIEHYVAKIPVDKIDFGKRYRVDYSKMEDLIMSLEENGLINPITVYEREDGRYTLVAGGRRLTAIKEIGWIEVEAKIFKEELDEYWLRTLELEENLQRENLTYQEEVRLKKKVHELMLERHGKIKVAGDGGWSVRKTAELLGESPTNTARDLELAEAIEKFEEVKKAKTKTSARRVLARLKEQAIKEELLKRQEKKLKEGKLKGIREILNSFVVGDFFEVSEEFPQGKAKLIEIDPPYGISIDDVKGETASDYNEVPADEYEEFMDKVLERVTSLAANNSWLVLWFAFDYYEMLHKLLKKYGWTTYSQPIVWTKGQGVTNNPSHRLASTYEPAIYAYRGEPFLNRPGAGLVFPHMAIDPQEKIHPTERPLSLMKDIVEIFTNPGDFIISPFLGSGKTLIAAYLSGRKAIGAELSKEYYKSFAILVEKYFGGQNNVSIK